MQSLLSSMVIEVNTRKHLSPLLEGVFLKVFITNGEAEYYLIIDDGKLRLEVNPTEIDVYIEGTEEALRLLLLGHVRLREASNKKLLKIKTTFKNQLLLESLFLLSMPGSNVTGN